MKKYPFIIYLLSMLFIITSCYYDRDFTLTAKYSTIRSYRNGGGVFIVEMTPVNNFSGTAELNLRADPELHAELSTDVLTDELPVAEITINPDQSAEIREYELELIATHSKTTKSITLFVEMYNWEHGALDTAMEKRDEFIEWLGSNHPQFGDFSYQEWFSYMTYPEILIVEHWTFLSSQWEMRLCYHVMIPPDDWSMILLRRRGEKDAIFAARREYDEDAQMYIINEIPVSDYPILFSY